METATVDDDASSGNFAVQVYITAEKRFRTTFIPSQATFGRLKEQLVNELAVENATYKLGVKVESGVETSNSVSLNPRFCQKDAAFHRIVIVHFSILRKRRGMQVPLEDRQLVALTLRREQTFSSMYGFYLLALVDIRHCAVQKKVTKKESVSTDIAPTTSSAPTGRRVSQPLKRSFTSDSASAPTDVSGDAASQIIPSSQRFRHFVHTDVVCGCTEWKLRVYGTGNDRFASDAPMSSSASDVSTHIGGISVRQILRRQFLSISESLFNAVGGIAVIQGRLQRLVSTSTEPEVWRDVYCMLERDRLWFFPLNRSSHLDEAGLLANDAAPSFISLIQGCSLDTERSVRAVQKSEVTFGRGGVTTAGGGSVFTIAIKTSAPITTTAMAMSDATVMVTLKANSVEQAKEWVQRASMLHALKPVAISAITATMTTNAGTTVVTKYRTKAPAQLPLHVLRRRRVRTFLELYSERKLSVASVALTVLRSEYGDSTSTAPPVATDINSQKNVGNHNAAEKLYNEINNEMPQVDINTLDEEKTWTIGSGRDEIAAPGDSNCNDVIAEVENELSVSERELFFRRHVTFLENAVTLEGLLCNRYLRGHFQKFLMTNSVEESLLFWEYAEDFRRGHPHSEHSFRHIEQMPLESLEDAKTINSWAASIYFAFIRYNAPYQVSHLGMLEVPRVLRLLKLASQQIEKQREKSNESKLGDAALTECVVPCDIFLPLQRAVFAMLRDDYLLAFQEHADFRHILAASVHATERARDGLELMSSFNSRNEKRDYELTVSQSSPLVMPVKPTLLSRIMSRRGSKRNDEIHRSQWHYNGSDKVDPTVRKGSKRIAAWRRTKFVAFDSSVLENDFRTHLSSEVVEDISIKNSRQSIRKRQPTHLIVDTSEQLRKLRSSGNTSRLTWLPDWWWLGTSSSEMKGHQLVEFDSGNTEAQNQTLVKNDLKLPNEDEEEIRLRVTSIPESSSSVLPLDWIIYDAKALFSLCGRWQDLTQNSTKSKCPQEQALHMEMLLQKHVDEQRAAESIFEDTPIARNKWGTYRPDMPQYLADINIHRARVLLEDYSQYQPQDFMSSPRVFAGMGTVIFVGMVKCRHFRIADSVISNASSSSRRVLMEQGLNSAGSGGMPILGSERSFDSEDTSIDSSKQAEMITSVNTLSSLHAAILSEAYHNQVVDGNAQSVNDNALNRKLPTSNSNSNNFSGESLSSNSSSIHPWAHGGATSSARYAMNGNMNNTDPASLSSRRSRQVLEDSGATHANITEWVRQYACLQVVLGNVHLMMLDPASLKHTATIHISALSRISPSDSLLHSIDMIDVFGLSWQMIPEGVDECDSRYLPRYWLKTLGAVTLPHTEVIYIIRSGYLMKRGKINKAFRQRWFVLSTDYKLRYFKDDATTSGWKGEIDLAMIDPSANEGKPITRFNREVVISMGHLKRDWILQAHDTEEAECWVIALNDLFSTIIERSDAEKVVDKDLKSAGFLLHRHTEVDEDDEEDDD